MCSPRHIDLLRQGLAERAPDLDFEVANPLDCRRVDEAVRLPQTPAAVDAESYPPIVVVDGNPQVMPLAVNPGHDHAGIASLQKPVGVGQRVKDGELDLLFGETTRYLG